MLFRSQTVASVYQSAHASREEMAWLGDSSFAWYVERLMLAKHPLIEFVDGGDIVEGLAQSDSDRFWKHPVQLTVPGREVATAQTNAIALNGIDRWLGGVRLMQPIP